MNKNAMTIKALEGILDFLQSMPDAEESPELSIEAEVKPELPKEESEIDALKKLKGV